MENKCCCCCGPCKGYRKGTLQDCGLPVSPYVLPETIVTDFETKTPVTLLRGVCGGDEGPFVKDVCECGSFVHVEYGESQDIDLGLF